MQTHTTEPQKSDRSLKAKLIKINTSGKIEQLSL